MSIALATRGYFGSSGPSPTGLASCGYFHYGLNAAALGVVLIHTIGNLPLMATFSGLPVSHGTTDFSPLGGTQ